MIETIQTDYPKTIGFRLSGRLRDEDYQQFEPTIESFLTAEGKVRMFVQFEDFHGWDLRGAWDDLKFGMKHYADFERVAIVGDRKWERWMAGLCKPFTQAKVKYFDRSQVDAAWKWLEEKEEVASGTEEDPRASKAFDDIGPWIGPWM